MEGSMDLRVTLREAARVLARETAHAVAIDVVRGDGSSATRWGAPRGTPERDAIAEALVGTTYPVSRAIPSARRSPAAGPSSIPRSTASALRASAPAIRGRAYRADGRRVDARAAADAARTVVGALMCSWTRQRAADRRGARPPEEVARRWR
jgi:hypothetical protein